MVTGGFPKLGPPVTPECVSTSMGILGVLNWDHTWGSFLRNGGASLQSKILQSQQKNLKHCGFSHSQRVQVPNN